MSWLLAFVGFSLLIILHEFGHFAAAKWVGMRVERFSLFFPPLLWRKQRGETEYAIGSIPLGGYVRISGMNPSEDLPEDVRDRAYHSQPVWKRMVVIAAGPAMNILLAFVLLFAYLALIGPGDRIVSVDGTTGSPAELSDAINAHACPGGEERDGCRAGEPVQLVIERDGARRTLELRPIYDPEIERMRLGFSYADDGPREPFALGTAFTETGERMWLLTRETAKLPARLLDAEQRKEISGVVGSYEVTRQTILDDLADVLGILALISLSLAIVNLFPFLPLDGGHIFWAIVEGIRRKPVPFAVMERSGVIGFMLVIGLFLIGLTNDIDRLSGEGFEVR